MVMANMTFDNQTNIILVIHLKNNIESNMFNKYGKFNYPGFYYLGLFFIIDWFTDPPTLLFGKLKKK